MMHPLRTALLRGLPAAACLLAFAATLPAADWTRFRGPNGTGTVDDPNVPVEWTESKNVLWKVEVPGVGSSSPIVCKGKVFVQSSSADKKERFLHCFDARSGKLAWSRSVPGGAAKTHPKNNLSSSTPATDGERVYAAFWDGKDLVLAAYDYRGELVWKRDTGKFAGEHGAGLSPIVVGDKVIINNDQSGKELGGTSSVQAYDAKTGEPAWKVSRPTFRACYSTPFLLEKTDAGPDVIVASTAGVTAYDPTNGHEVWNWRWKHGRMPLRTVGSPIYHQGMVFAQAGDGGGDRHLVAIKAGGKGDVSGTALAWEKKKETPYVPGMVAKGDYLYWVDDNGFASCAVAKTGEVVWKERVLNGKVFASLVMAGDRIYAFGENGTGSVFKASPKFEVLATNPVGEAVYATPAIADGRLYVRGAKHLICIGKP